MAGRLSKFSRRYSQFLSEADNDEIVSISKELTGELSDQIKGVRTAALAIMCLSMVSLMTSLLLAAISETGPTGYRNIVVLLRIGGMLAFLIGCLMASSAVSKAMKASAVSPLLWRNIRETATDEKAYEQMVAVRKLNKLLYTTRNSLSSATRITVVGAVVTGLSYMLVMFASLGYI